MNFFRWIQFWRKEPKQRIEVAARYKAQFRADLASAERKLGLKWIGKKLTMQAAPGTSRSGWMWCGPFPGGGLCGAYCQGYSTAEQLIVCYVDPAGNETSLELEHECGHAVLMSHGNWDFAYHHARMRQVQIYARAKHPEMSGEMMA